MTEETVNTHQTVIVRRTLSGTDRELPDLTGQIDRDSALCVAGGSYGDVYKCRYTNSSSKVAVKVLKYYQSEDPEENRKRLEELNRVLRREIDVWNSLQHENIVPLLGITRTFGPVLSPVSPWMLNGSLHHFIKTEGRTLTLDERLELVLGIATGLEYLHAKNVLHGDLHSGNVLIDEENRPRICDFGYASAIGELEPGMSYLHRLTSTGKAGAVRWAAPERLDGKDPHHSEPPADVYSFGCIMFEVLSGEIPWKDVGDLGIIVLKLTKKESPRRPLHASLDDQHWRLMEMCWSRPEQRPTSRAVVAFLHGDYSHVPALRQQGHAKFGIVVIVFFFNSTPQYSRFRRTVIYGIPDNHALPDQLFVTPHTR